MVMRRIYRALEAEIPTEIYCVLNDRSLPALEETLEAMKPYEDWVSVHPFPVRGPDTTRFFPPPEQLAVVRRLLERYDTYESLLPPRAYLLRLLRFFEEGTRTFRCHLPRFAFTTFDDGLLTACPNIWFNKVGNLLAEKPEDVTDRIGETGFYQLLLAERPRIAACKGCFTPWDLLTMYVDREITIDELCRAPMYAAPASRARIEAIARAFWSHTC
jgi:MoaA/NifB/PqqE/SkfB family radical SAM enzyme